jgi:hypothetical protein
MSLFRSLWIEDPENRSMIFEDRVNLFECKRCAHAELLPFAFIATNSPRAFAVWYEPSRDPAIDADVRGYRAMGMKHLAEAPRIAGWEDFKSTILSFERSAPTERQPSQKDLEAAREVVRRMVQDITDAKPRRKSGLLASLSRIFGRKV